MEQGLIVLVIFIYFPGSTLRLLHCLGSQEADLSRLLPWGSLALWLLAEVGQWEGRAGE